MTLKDKSRVIVDSEESYASVMAQTGQDPRETVFEWDDVWKAVSELKARIKIGSPSEMKGFRPNEASPRFYYLTNEEVLNTIDEIFGDFGDFTTELELWKAKLILKSEERKMPMAEVEKELDDYIARVKKAKVS